jgi:hypothetical protein
MAKLRNRKILRSKNAKTMTPSNTRSQGRSFFDFTGNSGFFAGTTYAGLSRKCHSCEKEDKKVSRSEKGGGEVKTTSASTYVDKLQGGGAPLAESTRKFFESRFKADLGKVRIHTDKEAAEAASGINAQAFTYKNHIVFDKGQFNPETEEGKRLLAHELTHVVQQSPGIAKKEIEHSEEEKLQRAAHSDFAIKGLYPGASANPDVIYFEMGESTIPPSEVSKLAPLAAPAARSITLTGTLSEEGEPAANASLMHQRIASVKSGLKANGHTGPKIPNSKPAAGVGQMDYRRQRAVEVSDTPAVVPKGGVDPSHTPSCDAGPVIPCGTAFGEGFTPAVLYVANAHFALSAGTPDAVAHVSTLFPGKKTSDISPHVNSLLGQMQKLPGQHECHNSCDGGCGRPAYNNGSGSNSMMTLCEGYMTSSADFKAYLLIHEALHATPGLTTEDIAYSTTRLISLLSGDEAMRNTDSYVLLILRLAGAATGAAPPPTDNFNGFAPAELPVIKSTFAFLEQWLDKSEFDTSLFYQGIKKNIGRAGGWDPKDAWEAESVHHVASQFGLTDPGPAPFATSPNAVDKWIMAGVYDRYTRMNSGVYVRPISFSKAASDPGVWDAGIGPNAQVGPAFFAGGLTAEDRVKLLFTMMIRSIPGEIPVSRINAYIEASNIIRKRRGVGP